MIPACDQSFWQKLVEDLAANDAATKIIAIVDAEWGVAKGGEIPWSFEEDRKLFYELTKNSVVIMGKKTFESLSYRPLKNRINCVISRTVEESEITKVSEDGVRFFYSLEEALKVYRNSWIIGGAEIYNYALSKHLVDEAIITKMHRKFGADKFINRAILASRDIFEKVLLKQEEDYSLFRYKKIDGFRKERCS